MEGLDALKISEEKKKYIVDSLNPLLEEMVAECIHRMPEDPVPFMLDWLEDKKVTDEDKLLSPEEKERLLAENKNLELEISKVKGQLQEASKMVAVKHEEEEEEEEDDDLDDEPPPDFFDRPQTNKARTSVSAEAYGEWNLKKAFVPPVITKSDEQKDRLKSTLTASFMFANLEANDLNIVIGAMKEVSVGVDENVINQGDSGDFLFVIESGKFDCIKDDKVVKTCQSGDVFGELALLYNCPRAATVKSKEKGVLWQLDRETFNAIVKEAAQKKRQRYDTFLAKVPLLSSMDAYERSQLADALRSESFDNGQTIVSQGEVGNKFYIIEEGEAVAKKNGVEVMSYAVGDYFGELALIRNQPRAATVTCKGNAKMLSIDKGSFHRLLKVDDLLERSAKYS
jgi:cAMP-dependent protein kinase regulator